LEIHVRGYTKQPAVVGQGVFGERGTSGSHDLVADLDALRFRSKFGDLARPFHAEDSAHASSAAVHVAFGHAEVRAVEAAGVDADQDLRALWHRLCDLGNGGAVGAIDISLHGVISRVQAAYSAASRRASDIMPSSRLRMMVSASRTMRDTSSVQVGM